MKINILMGPFLAPPPAPSGAVERRWSEMARAFVRAGHDVTIVCRDDPALDGWEAVSPRLLRTRGYSRGRWLPVDLAKDLIYSRRALGILPRADVTVTNSFWFPVLARRRDRTGALVVNVARMPKGQLRLYRRVDRLSAVSEAVGEEIRRQAPELAGRVRVIPNPIDTDVFRPPVAPRPARARRTILYAGRIHPEKGIEILIDAFRAISAVHTGWRLEIIGPWRVETGGGGGGYRAELERRASGLDVAFVEPEFDKSRLVTRYHEADVFCYPSVAEKGESFGLAPLEAMATGLPVVVSGLECFREFIQPGVDARVFDHRGPDPAKSLAEELENVIGDDLAARALGGRAAERALQFSVDDIAERYLADWESLAAPARETALQS